MTFSKRKNYSGGGQISHYQGFRSEEMDITTKGKHWELGGAAG